MSADAAHAATTKGTRWRIDPVRSRVEFNAKASWGMAAVKGTFSRYRGTLDLGVRPAIELTLDGDSLDTKNARRDKHLRSPDFFDVEAHPQLRFVSESASLDGEHLTVEGRLHARGASMPVSVHATLRPIGDELEVEANTETDHHELGMTWNFLGMLRTPSRLTIKGRLVREEA